MKPALGARIPLERRDLLKNLLASACVPQLMAVANRFPSAVDQEAPEPDNFLDQPALDFWSKTVRLGAKRAEEGLPDSSRIPEFLIYTEEDKGFRTITEIRKSELISSGDTKVTLWFNQFRPSKDDIEKSKSLSSATLRVDVRQQKPLFPFLGALSWSLMAALFSKKANILPKAPDPSPDVGVRVQDVPLPGGSGRWTWNVFAQEERSWLSKFVSFVIGEAVKFVPLLSLPAMTVQSLKAFDTLFGYWQARATSKWLFNTADLDVYSTKAGADAVNPQSAIPLVKGTYILIPQNTLAQFTPVRDKMVIQRGVIVPKGTDPTDVFVAAAEALPGVTYATVDVKVENAASPPQATKPKED